MSGNWWNPDESGTGYAIDVKNGILVMTTYSYNVDGSAQWYLSAGQLVNNTATMTLDAYRSGQCIACPYTGRPVLAGSAGTATVRFSSSTSAILQLPGGRSIAIRPLDFGGGPSTQ